MESGEDIRESRDPISPNDTTLYGKAHRSTLALTELHSKIGSPSRKCHS